MEFQDISGYLSRISGHFQDILVKSTLFLMEKGYVFTTLIKGFLKITRDTLL